MQKVTLTKVFTTDKDKSGNALMSKQGKPYTRMFIKTQEHGEKWISGFQNKANDDWREEDTVELILEEKGEYLNFNLPKQEDIQQQALAKVEFKLGAISLRLSLIEEHLGIKSADDYKTIGQSKQLETVDYPEEQIDIDEIPF